MKNAFALLLPVILAGCAIGAQTKEEMYGDYGYLEERCWKMSHKEAVDLLYGKMNECLARDPGPLNAGPFYGVEKEFSPPVSAVTLSGRGIPGHKFYLTVVKVEETAECPSKISVYGVSSLNKTHIQLIDEWKDGYDGCEVK